MVARKEYANDRRVCWILANKWTNFDMQRSDARTFDIDNEFAGFANDSRVRLDSCARAFHQLGMIVAFGQNVRDEWTAGYVIVIT